MYRWILTGLWLLAVNNSFAQNAERMNIRYKRMGTCAVASGVKDTRAAGGFEPSDNYPKSFRTPAGARLFADILNQHNNIVIALVLDTVATVNFNQKHKGYGLYLMNATSTALRLNAEDSRLNLLAEVWMDDMWQPIEYLPKVTCGNSRHKVYLPKGQYWQLIVPQYEGTIASRIRYRLALPNGFFLYSKEVNTSINKEQLTIKEEDVKAK